MENAETTAKKFSDVFRMLSQDVDMYANKFNKEVSDFKTKDSQNWIDQNQKELTNARQDAKTISGKIGDFSKVWHVVGDFCL